MQVSIQDVQTSNAAERGVYCSKNKKDAGFKAKIQWIQSAGTHGYGMKIVADEKGKQQGFIEFMDSEDAWRPISASNYIFIQCIAFMSKALRNQGLASSLLEQVEAIARKNGKSGLCTMSSDGPWMADRRLFIKNGFKLIEEKGRFQLLVKSWSEEGTQPSFYDWEKEAKNFPGWHLVYADQCPWHQKAVTELTKTAMEFGISLNVTRLESAIEAQHAPSGFGTFSLLKDGKLLEDHYISATRFRNILKKEL